MPKLKKSLCLHVCWVHTSSLCVSKKKAIAEREYQRAAVRKKAKKADEKAKLHVGARLVIGRQKAAAEPLLIISHQKTRHEVPICPNTWTEAVSDFETSGHW